MPKGGFEPPRLVRHHPLKMACLPLPPLRHARSTEGYSLAGAPGHCQWLSRPMRPYCACFGGSAGGAGASWVGGGGVSDAGGVVGAGTVSVTGGSVLSVIDEPWPPPDDMYARPSDVSMNSAAETAVRRERNVAGPRLPKKVCDELAPPKAAPMDWPFPTCSNTTRIKARDTVTCTVTSNAKNTFTSSHT